MENTDELIIDETNFDQYFFDVRKHRPKEGQVMAKFSAIAVFGDGPHKHDIIKILKMDKAKQAAAVMQKIHHARMPDCYRICAEMCEDLASGMSDEEVAAKEYEYVLEAFYYTQKELVPKDPHWELIKLVSYDPESGKFSVNLNV
jgi:hypothetical protein